MLTVELDKPDTQKKQAQVHLSEVEEENSVGEKTTGPSTMNFFSENTKGRDVPTLGASKGGYVGTSKSSPRSFEKSSSGGSSKASSGFLSGLFSPRSPSSAPHDAPAAAPGSRPGSARGAKSPRKSPDAAAAPAAAGLQHQAL